MTSEWDAEDFTPPPVPRAADKWAGEDEEDKIKANWDDEEEEEEKDETQTAESASSKKKKPVAKRIAEKEEKKRREMEQLMAQEKEMTEEEKLAEKLRLRKMQEEENIQLAREAFGDGRSRIDFMIPITREEFDEFREALVQKISNFKEETIYASFMEQLVRDLCIGLEAEDVRKITSSLTVIANEKRKDKQKKKAGKSKPSIKNIKDNDIGLYDAYTGGGGGRGEDDFDDFI